MIAELPWVIQKTILDFNVRHELHKDIKRKIKIYEDIGTCNIQDKKLRKYIRDCMYISTLTDELRDTDWYVWILTKLYRGERPWVFISEEYVELIDYLRKCYRLRFKNTKKYGFSIKSWIMRFLTLL